MAVNIEIDTAKLAELEKFFTLVKTTVEKAVQRAAVKEAKNIRKTWRTRSTSGDVPGDFSESWIARKRSKGFRTEPLQRFGRGDNRSYYDSLKVVEMKPLGGAFVGVVKGTAAYGENGKKSSETLDEVAESLEERFPLWQDIFQKRPPKLMRTLKKVLKEELMQLGAADAK